MRRKGHPSFPSAMTCCFFSSLKTLLMPTEAIGPSPESMSRALSLAGFEVITETFTYCKTVAFRFWMQVLNSNS